MQPVGLALPHRQLVGAGCTGYSTTTCIQPAETAAQLTMPGKWRWLLPRRLQVGVVCSTAVAAAAAVATAVVAEVDLQETSLQLSLLKQQHMHHVSQQSSAAGTVLCLVAALQA